ncbi:hypothetical protein RQP46_004691 [Phenoliferia psychrophenolica]
MASSTEMTPQLEYAAGVLEVAPCDRARFVEFITDLQKETGETGTDVSGEHGVAWIDLMRKEAMIARAMAYNRRLDEEDDDAAHGYLPGRPY